MSDSKEQAKGGSLARAAREQERLDVLAGLHRDAVAEGIIAEPPATAGTEAEGTPPVAPSGTVGPTSAYPPTDERQARRGR